jgi:hypothetical protein
MNGQQSILNCYLELNSFKRYIRGKPFRLKKLVKLIRLLTVIVILFFLLRV